MRNRSIRQVYLVLAAALSSGCITSGNYHSAKVLEPGESSFGVTASVFSVGTPDGGRIALPNLIPEITYHVGVADNLEIGGRVALGSLALGLDAKYRFYQSDSLHLAVAPGLDYQAAFVVQGITAKLPVVATFDLSPNFGVNIAPIGTFTRYSETDADFGDLGGSLFGIGGALSFDIRGETFVLRPGVEYTRYTARIDSDSIDDFDAVDVFSFFIHGSFIRGREKQQLNRIENKLDRVLDERQPRDPNYAPYPPPAQNPPPPPPRQNPYL